MTPSDLGKLVPVSHEPPPQTVNPVATEPFRQSSSSTHVYTPITDDAIVIVGQSSARQRKRKREKSSGGASAPRPGQDTDVIAFDYSTVPNLLDGSIEREKVGENDEKNKKSRQSKSESSGVSFLVVQNWFRPLQNWMVIFLFCFSPCVTCYSGFFLSIYSYATALSPLRFWTSLVHQLPTPTGSARGQER